MYNFVKLLTIRIVSFEKCVMRHAPYMEYVLSCFESRTYGSTLHDDDSKALS